MTAATFVGEPDPLTVACSEALREVRAGFDAAVTRVRSWDLPVGERSR